MKRIGVPDWANPKIKNARIPSPEGSAEDGGADADYVPSSKEIEEKNKRRLAAIAAMPVGDFNASQEFIVKEVERMRPRVPAGWIHKSAMLVKTSQGHVLRGKPHPKDKVGAAQR